MCAVEGESSRIFSNRVGWRREVGGGRYCCIAGEVGGGLTVCLGNAAPSVSLAWPVVLKLGYLNIYYV